MVNDGHLGQGKAYVTRPYFAVLGGLHAKYGLPPHRMTSKAINDIKKFSAADRAKWLEIKRNDSNASKKRECAVVAFNAMKMKRKTGGD